MRKKTFNYRFKCFAYIYQPYFYISFHLLKDAYLLTLPTCYHEFLCFTKTRAHGNWGVLSHINQVLKQRHKILNTSENLIIEKQASQKHKVLCRKRGIKADEWCSAPSGPSSQPIYWLRFAKLNKSPVRSIGLVHTRPLSVTSLRWAFHYNTDRYGPLNADIADPPFWIGIHCMLLILITGKQKKQS